jgi:myo-inositol 2-dehydrogenase / D-chiro-inositol 1-dehydrogenase
MQLRVAVVGTGNVATRNYLPFLARQKDVSLSYYNRTPAKAEACAAQFGGHAVGSIEELVGEDPDAVMVLTRESARYECALAVLAGRPRRIFFEKPLVAQAGQAHVTEDDFVKGREVLHLARAVGTETAMQFNYRFFAQTRRARELLAERQLGKLIQVTGLVHYACWSHCIDLVQHLAGPVAGITAVPGALEHDSAGMQAHDVAAAFTTLGGATGTILGTCGISFAFPLFELLFGFEEGRLTFRGLDGDLELLDYRGNRHELFSLTRQTSQWDQYSRSFEEAIGAYLAAIRANAEPPVPGLAGLQELQFEAALQRSIRLRRPVDVQTEFPLG